MPPTCPPKESDAPMLVNRPAIMVFFYSATCGHSRRMDSLLDHFLRQHRDQLRLAKVDLAARSDLAERFKVTSAPTILLLNNMREAARLEGRHTLPTIRGTFEHLFIPPSEVDTIELETLEAVV
jgi:thioredoxin-like negative regulator of GroEL